MVIQQQSSPFGQLVALNFTGTEDELKKLAFFLMDAVEEGTSMCKAGNTVIRIQLNPELTAED